MFLAIYCVSLFGGCEENDLNDLQVLQNRAARLVTDSFARVPRKELFDNVGWMTVRQLIFYHTILTTFRIRQSGEPEYLNDLMTRDNNRGSIIVPNTKLSLAKKSYCFRASVQWNCLPVEIRNIETKQRFKSELRKWILENVPQF